MRRVLALASKKIMALIEICNKHFSILDNPSGQKHQTKHLWSNIRAKKKLVK